MKGIIFNLLEEVAERDFGEGAWDQLLDQAKVAGVYTSLGSYPDAELMALVAAATRLLGRAPEDVLRWFGAAALQLMAERYPVFFDGHHSLLTFLPTINDVIHKEVRKIYAGAGTPDFRFDRISDGHLVMSYVSSRGLCMFAEGLLEGAASRFAEDVTIQQPQCLHFGDAQCVFDVTFHRRAS
jgi:hypothetical protein